jgi:hypothetical protein
VGDGPHQVNPSPTLRVCRLRYTSFGRTSHGIRVLPHLDVLFLVRRSDASKLESAQELLGQFEVVLCGTQAIQTLAGLIGFGGFAGCAQATLQVE